MLRGQMADITAIGIEPSKTRLPQQLGDSMINTSFVGRVNTFCGFSSRNAIMFSTPPPFNTDSQDPDAVLQSNELPGNVQARDLRKKRADRWLLQNGFPKRLRRGCSSCARRNYPESPIGKENKV